MILSVVMPPKTAREQRQRLRNLEATALTGRCARFALDHALAIVGARPLIPPNLNDRAADIWEPLLMLARLAGCSFPDLSWRRFRRKRKRGKAERGSRLQKGK